MIRSYDCITQALIGLSLLVDQLGVMMGSMGHAVLELHPRSSSHSRDPLLPLLAITLVSGTLVVDGIDRDLIGQVSSQLPCHHYCSCIA